MTSKERHAYYYPTIKSKELRALLQQSLSSRNADALLLSGGIDSSALAALDHTIPAYTTSLKGVSEQLDLKFASKVAKHLRLDWTPVVVTQEEAIENLRLVIRINESYDTALLNDLALYLSINKAMTDLGKLNVVVRSGEPADMLFRGYTVTYKMRQSELNLDIDKLSSTNLPLASLERKTQIKMDYPYLDTNIKEFAKNLSKDENVVYRTRPGDVWSTHEENTDRLTMPPYPFGKLVLRQAMFDILPIEIVLRNKTDIQFGSGTDNLKAQLRETISPLERAAYEAEGFSFRDIVHAAMYKLFKKEGLHPRKLLTETETSCSSCHGAVEVGRNYCITCGSEHPNVSFDEIRKSK